MLLELVTPKYIYHSCSTQKTFWEENFTPIKMRSFGRCNVRKNMEINNGDQYIDLKIYLKLDCLYKRKFTSSGSRDYVGIPDKGLTTSLTLMTKSPNNKQKWKTAINDTTHQDFRKLLNKYKKLPQIGYKKKKVHNKPTESYLFLVKHISKLLKRNNHVLLYTQKVKLEAVGTKHVNKKIQSVITSMNEE